MFDDVRIRLRALVRRRTVEQELEEELRHHLATQVEHYLALGCSDEEATRRARRDFGGVDQVKEECRDARGVRFIEDAWRDVVFGCRSLWRHRVSSAAAIGTLAIGIGVNAGVFAVVDWVLLRPLPYPEARELVRVSSDGPTETEGLLAYSEVQALDQVGAWRASAGFNTALRVMAGPGLEPSHVVVGRVTGDLFATLGVSPILGRGFDRQEIEDGTPVVVVSHALWTNRLSRSPGIVGQVMTIDGSPHTIVGVMPAGRWLPRDADLWRPLTAEESEDDDREHVMIARLGAGGSVERASSELEAVGPRVLPNGVRVRVEELQRSEVRGVRETLWALMASAGLILLIACANVGALLGARSADRLGETAIHGALGATQGRLLRRLLTETLLLAAIGGGLGLLLGHWTLRLVVRLAPASLPRLDQITLDTRVVLVGLVATLMVSLAAGLGPAVRASRLDLRSILGLAGSGRATGRTRSRRVLVVAQTAMAIVVTIGAGLLGRSIQHLVRIDHGFAPDRLLAVDLYLRGGYSGDLAQLFRDLVDAAEAVPGVQSAAVTLRLPTEVTGLRVPVKIDGSASRAPMVVTLRPVTPGFFQTVGIPLIEGRLLATSDRRNVAAVALANAAFVRQVLDGGQALGRRVTTDLVERGLSIAGVVGDVTPGGASDRPALYVSTEQVPVAGGSLVVRTEGEPGAMLSELTGRLRSVAPGLAFDRTHELAEVLAAGRAVTRFNALLAAGFAGIALLLAAIGVYGLTAGEVAARWRELGVRLALGASSRMALWTVLRPGVRALVLGVMIGLALALAVGQWMASLLHGVGPADPPTLLAVVLTLGLVGLVAASLAALPVLRGDPAATLRQE